MPSIQARAWCWTLNNPTEEDVLRMDTLVPDKCSFSCYGRERGESGTFHLQGYSEFPRKITLTRAKIELGSRCHLEVRRGTQDAAITYCKKDGAFSSSGTPARMGERTDLHAVVAELKAGKKLKDVALNQPEIYCRYRNGLKDIASFLQEPRTAPPQVIWIYGKAGTGKSRFAHEYNGDQWSYGGDGWFDGYIGQHLAIFDDFADDCLSSRGITYGMFLKLCDRYRLQVPIKGGFVEWRPEIIIFTSNRPLESIYTGAGGYVFEAVRRRIGRIIYYDGLGIIEQ